MKLRNMKSSFLTLSIAGILSLSFLEDVYAVKVELDKGHTPAKNPEDKYLTEVREKMAEFRADIINIRYEEQQVIAVDRNQGGIEIARLDLGRNTFEVRDWTSLMAGASVLKDKGQDKPYDIEIYPAGSDIDPGKTGIFQKYGFKQNVDGSWKGVVTFPNLKELGLEWAYADYDKNGAPKADLKMKVILPDLDEATVWALKDGFDSGKFKHGYAEGKYMHELVPALKSYAEIVAWATDKPDGIYNLGGLTFHKRGQNAIIMDLNRQIMWFTDSAEASRFKEKLKDAHIDCVDVYADFNPPDLRGDAVFSGSAGTADPGAPNPRWDSHDNWSYGFSGVAAGPIAEGSVLRFSGENYKRAQELYGQLLGDVVSRIEMTSGFKA